MDHTRLEPTDFSLEPDSTSTKPSYRRSNAIVAHVNGSTETYVTFESSYDIPGEEFRTVLSYVTACVCLGVVLGNGLVLASLLRFPWLRSHTNYVIASFSLTALADGLVLAPMDLVQGLGNFSMSSALCTAASYTDLTVSLLCLFQLIIVNGERYIAIQYPLRYKSLVTTRLAVGTVVLSWVLAVVLGTVIVFFFCETDNRIECNATPVSGTVALFLAFFLFWLPFMTCVIMYVRIYLIVRQHRAFLNTQTGHASRTTGKSGILKVIAGVLGTTLLGFGPLCTAMSIAYYVDDSTRETLLSYVLPVCRLLLHVGLALNPLIYALASPSLKAGIRMTCGCSQSGKDSQSSASVQGQGH